MMPSTSQLISKIKGYRYTVLPPFTYDDDMGAVAQGEYTRFYAGCGSRPLGALDSYESALVRFFGQPASDTSFDQLCSARREFIATSPFCVDEIARMPVDEQAGAVAQMRGLFEGVNLDRTVGNIRAYRALLERLIAALQAGPA